MLMCMFMYQAALRQQMAMQQRQEAMRLLSTLTPEQREQLGRLPPVQQVAHILPRSSNKHKGFALADVQGFAWTRHLH